MTSDADGNLAVDTSLSTSMASLRSQVEDNSEGIAMAMALDTPYVPPSATFAVSGGIATFEGYEAMAVSFGYRVNPNTQIDAGVTYGFDRNQTGARIGVTYAW